MANGYTSASPALSLCEKLPPEVRCSLDKGGKTGAHSLLCPAEVSGGPCPPVSMDMPPPKSFGQ